MRVEAVASETAGNTSSRRSRRPQRRPRPAPALVQRLFDTCREVFAHGEAGGVPSAGEVERMRSVLDQMKPKDVGLAQSMPYFRNTGNEGRPPVTYLHLYKCEKFSIGIFCLPPSAVIPLHNHPGMTVFSKLLFGSMHIKSYDWADGTVHQQANVSNVPQTHPPQVRLAKVNTDVVFKDPCKTSVLYPAAGGNMHCFTALTPCAILDVLGPPYSDDESRPCTYYIDHPYASFPGDSASAPGDHGEAYAWLEEMERSPDDFSVEVDMYTGPEIVEN